MTRQGLAAAATLALVLVGPIASPARADEPLSVEDYAAALDTLQRLVDEQRLGDAQAQARTLRARSVAWGDETLVPDASALDALVDARSAGEAAHAARRLGRLASALRRPAGETATADVRRDVLERLAPADPLKRGGEVASLRVKPLTLPEQVEATLLSVADAIAGALRAIREWLERLRPARAGPKQALGSTAVAAIAFALAVVVLLAMLVVRRKRLPVAGPDSEPARPLTSRRDEDPLSREASEWERHAAELAAARRWREAIRAWYHAVLVALFRTGPAPSPTGPHELGVRVPPRAGSCHSARLHRAHEPVRPRVVRPAHERRRGARRVCAHRTRPAEGGGEHGRPRVKGLLPLGRRRALRSRGLGRDRGRGRADHGIRGRLGVWRNARRGRARVPLPEAARERRPRAGAGRALAAARSGSAGGGRRAVQARAAPPAFRSRPRGRGRQREEEVRCPARTAAVVDRGGVGARRRSAGARNAHGVRPAGGPRAARRRARAQGLPGLAGSGRAHASGSVARPRGRGRRRGPGRLRRRLHAGARPASGGPRRCGAALRAGRARERSPGRSRSPAPAGGARARRAPRGVRRVGPRARPGGEPGAAAVRLGLRPRPRDGGARLRPRAVALARAARAAGGGRTRSALGGRRPRAVALAALRPRALAPRGGGTRSRRLQARRRAAHRPLGARAREARARARRAGLPPLRPIGEIPAAELQLRLRSLNDAYRRLHEHAHTRRRP